MSLLAEGQLIDGRYELDHRIAVGGMGEVWEAADTRLGRSVAVKILRAELSGDEEFLHRFRIEARTVASLDHPGIAHVHDYGEDTDVVGRRTAYLVMELVRGEPLSALVARGPIDPDETLRLLEHAAWALHAAHERGFVHRDVKPGNILVAEDGRVKLTDFGIAKAANAAPVTRSGMVMGTAHYIAPEQATGGEAGPTGDVYSLGIVGYECLTGQRPFRGDNAVDVAAMQVRDAPPPLPDTVPVHVRTLIDAVLVKDPALRYATGEEFAMAVAAVRRGEPTPLPAGLAGEEPSADPPVRKRRWSWGGSARGGEGRPADPAPSTPDPDPGLDVPAGPPGPPAPQAPTPEPRTPTPDPGPPQPRPAPEPRVPGAPPVPAAEPMAATGVPSLLATSHPTGVPAPPVALHPTGIPSPAGVPSPAPETPEPGQDAPPLEPEEPPAPEPRVLGAPPATGVPSPPGAPRTPAPQPQVLGAPPSQPGPLPTDDEPPTVGPDASEPSAPIQSGVDGSASPTPAAHTPPPSSAARHPAPHSPTHGTSPLAAPLNITSRSGVGRGLLLVLFVLLTVAAVVVAYLVFVRGVGGGVGEVGTATPNRPTSAGPAGSVTGREDVRVGWATGAPLVAAIPAVDVRSAGPTRPPALRTTTGNPVGRPSPA